MSSESGIGTNEVVEMEHISIASMHAPHLARIHDVQWRVRAGEFWAVAGLPGAGKSDLLLTAAGLLAPLSGEHRLFGQRIQGRPDAEQLRVRLRVGLVFSDEGRLFTHLTAAENLALPFCYHHNCEFSEARDRVDAVLRWTGLEELADRLPMQIPRNFRERVALARALVLRPELLLLDDPIRGMDPRQIRWWLRFLEGLHGGHELTGGKPLTVVVATDHLRPWVELSNRFGLIHEGRWTVANSPTELSELKEPQLQELLME